MHDLTIVIVAYNAEQTIERAVLSAVASGAYPILLVDDGSVDDTVYKAKAAGGEQIRVVKQPANLGVGAARNRAVHEVKTTYGMWLDADDEIMPDRPEAMLKALLAGADIVYDSGILIDEPTGKVIKTLKIPEFMFEPGADVRCFERNWYPLLHCGFLVSLARAIGFDESYTCAEDYDFLLHAIIREARIVPLANAGYRYYHREGTISRNLEKTRGFVKQSLSKYGLSEFEDLLHLSELSVTEQLGILAGMALYRQDYAAAYRYSQSITERDAPIVPYVMKAGLYADFIAASALAAMSRWQEAYDILWSVNQEVPAADLWNNLGVAAHHLGRSSEAAYAFQEALQLMPDYVDAKRNAEAGIPVYWTTHPLRRQDSRNNYST
ncbi:MAG: glycosyltransferase [Kordiimonas sp.]